MLALPNHMPVLYDKAKDEDPAALAAVAEAGFAAAAAEAEEAEKSNSDDEDDPNNYWHLQMKLLKLAGKQKIKENGVVQHLI